MLKHLKKLAQSQQALTACYRYSLVLQERGWMRFPAASWDCPAFAVFDHQGKCIGALNYQEDKDELELRVRFAFCDPAHPRVLTQLLVAFRAKFRDSDYTAITFVAHTGNEQMMRAAKILGLEPKSHGYKMELV